MKVSVYHTCIAMMLGGVIALSGVALAPVAHSAFGPTPIRVKDQGRLPKEQLVIPVVNNLGSLVECEVDGAGCADMDDDSITEFIPPKHTVPTASFDTLRILGYPVAIG